MWPEPLLSSWARLLRAASARGWGVSMAGAKPCPARGRIGGRNRSRRRRQNGLPAGERGSGESVFSGPLGSSVALGRWLPLQASVASCVEVGGGMGYS